MYVRAALWVLLALPLPLSAATTNLIQNGSFESNGGANSNLLPGWSIVDETGGSGTWVAQTGTTGPVTSTCGPDDVDAPPDGAFAAMSTQAAAGSHALYQDVTIPAGASPVLSFQYFIRSASALASPDDLSFHAPVNQQFRVDVIDPASNPFTVNVLQPVLVIGDGNPKETAYATHAVVLRGLGGRTVRIRFVEVDNQGCFYAGVDNVKVEIGGSDPTVSIARFTGSPRLVRFAGAVTLTWDVENATSVEIDNGIGAVAASGSRSVSLQEDTTFTLTATGPGGTAMRTVHVEVQQPGPTVQFSAAPSFIEKGQPATLSWSTTDATDVSIDNNIDAVATSGSLNVTPTQTTEYTLTATGSGRTSSARATVFVDPGDVPIVSVTSFPSGVVRVAGTAGTVVDHFALTNLGRVGTTIQLGQSGDFFTQSPASFALPAGATQVVTITMTATAPGNYQGVSIPSGTGFADGHIAVRMFLSTAPTGTVAPTTAVVRTEIAAPAGENPSGSVSFKNSGTGTLQGIVTSDVAWLIPQSDLVVIGPGETKDVTFTTNRALRPDAASPAGAAVGTLTLTYLDFGGASIVTNGGEGSGSTPSTISVTVVDVVKASVVPAAPPPLTPGEVAYFVPGLAQLAKSSGDLIVSVIGNSVSDLRLYLGTPGTAPILGSLDQIAPNAGLALPSILQSLFASKEPVGTVQARSNSLSRVALAGIQTITPSTTGSFLTALPTFRSDHSTGPNEIVFLPGVEKGTARTTNVYVQEVTGVSGSAKIEVLAASGDVLSTREDELSGFGLLSLSDAVPAGAAAVRVTNTSRSAARINAYATVVDATTSDAWTIVGEAAAEQIVAVVPPGAKTPIPTNELFLLNPDASPLEITIENLINPSRHRSVRADAVSTDAAPVTIGPRQTVALPIRFGSGFVRVTAAKPFVASARSTQVSYGSALPVWPASSALTVGQSRRFGGVDAASRATIAAASPVTYRSSLGLIESSGQRASVRLTLRYTFGAGSKVSAQGVSTVTVDVAANHLLMLDEIARAVIGPSRDALGDLRNMQLDVEVLSGGRVLPFVETIDNASADAAIRVQ